MPSPLAHMAVGLLAGRAVLVAPRSRPSLMKGFRDWWRFLAAAMALALLPDLGTAAGVITGDMGRFHNAWEHSLVVGAFAALVAGGLGRLRGKASAARWFWVTLLAYELHVVMDYLTIGRGVKIWWPFSSERFSPPFKLFYGLHWSDGWLTHRHLITLLTELLFVTLLLLGFLLWDRRRRAAADAARLGGPRDESAAGRGPQ